MDEEALIVTARTYAFQHGLTLAERLGSGKDGIVYLVESNTFPGKTALKILHDADAYRRETQVYKRLRTRGIHAVAGFHIPLIICCDDRLMALEMTVVSPPFLLDFAGAYLDAPPEFSDEIWEHWEAEKSEQFGDHWEAVQIALAKLQGLGIHMLDASPNNIRFE